MAVSAPPSASTPPEDLFRNRSFWIYWCARVFSILGAQIQTVAIGWEIYAITHDPMALGIAGLLQFLPALLFTLASGQVADSFNRRHIVTLSQVGYVLIAFWLWWGASHAQLTATGLYVVAFLFGTVRTFEFPCAAAVLPGLVRNDQLPRAISLTSSARQAALIGGPALGGVLYALHVYAAFGVSTLLFASAGIATWAVRYEQSRNRAGKTSLKTMLAGIAYIRTQPILLGAISLDLFAVLLGGVTALLPVFSRDILDAGPTGLGFLRAAPGVGALLMSLYLVRYPITRNAGKILYASVALFGLSTLVFAFSTSVTLSILAMIILGAADMVSVVVRDSVVQLETPDEMRGRVNSVNWLFIGASNQLGEFESGVTAAWWGPVTSAAVGGIGTLLITLGWIKLFPALWQRNSLVEEQPVKEPR